MKRFTRSIAAIALACASASLLTGCGENDPVAKVSHPGYDKEAPTEIAAISTNVLAIDLYHRLSDEASADANLFYSPISISTALMLAYEGASGSTREAFESILSMKDTDPENAHRAYAGVLGRLSGKNKPYELATANALWVQQSKPLKSDYIDTLKSYYAVSLESVDFVTGYEAQRQRINDWVAVQTKDRIKDLLPDNSLNKNTSVVLVNAIYFNARWSSTFEKSRTEIQPFYRQQGAVQVPMMRQSWAGFMHADLEGYDAVQMYYDKSRLSMLVLLPDEKDGLAALEKRLSTALVTETIDQLTYGTVNLWVPKWQMTEAYDLTRPLRSMGLDIAFGEDADFSAMRDGDADPGLLLSKVVHKAFIKVDEEGTEAAAATAEIVEDAAEDIDEPFDFRADHPFIYLIMDDRTDTILFMGRVTDPS